MRVLSLFSGGGLGDYGLTLSGMEIVGQVEIDEYCQKILSLRWPNVPKWKDIRDVKTNELPECDLISGGFPCQDISVANTSGKGLDGERSGLWREFFRIIRDLRPKYALVENSSNLVVRGLGRLLGDLAEIGYDAEWHCIPASYLGANHGRDRIWIVAYPQRMGQQQRPIIREGIENRRTYGESYNGSKVCNRPSDHWAVEPGMGRVAYGIKNRMDRIKALGNGQCPQVVEWIGKQIMKFEENKLGVEGENI